jgi:hypothetical protein
MVAEIASHINLPINLFIKLSKHKEKWVRASIAANKSCPSSILQSLAEDKCECVRFGLAVINPIKDYKALRKLIFDNHTQIREMAEAYS